MPPSSLTPNGLRFDKNPHGVKATSILSVLEDPKLDQFPTNFGGPASNVPDFLGKMLDTCADYIDPTGDAGLQRCLGIEVSPPDCTERSCCGVILRLDPGDLSEAAEVGAIYILSPFNPPGAPPPPPASSGSGGCGGGCIGGIIGGCFVLVLVCILWLSGAFAKSGCPSPFAKKTPKDAGVTMTNINDVNAAALAPAALSAVPSYRSALGKAQCCSPN